MSDAKLREVTNCLHYDDVHVLFSEEEMAMLYDTGKRSSPEFSALIIAVELVAICGCSSGPPDTIVGDVTTLSGMLGTQATGRRPPRAMPTGRARPRASACAKQ
jgi:hypothetical protein